MPTLCGALIFRPDAEYRRPGYVVMPSFDASYVSMIALTTRSSTKCSHEVPLELSLTSCKGAFLLLNGFFCHNSWSPCHRADDMLFYEMFSRDCKHSVTPCLGAFPPFGFLVSSAVFGHNSQPTTES